MLSVISQLAWLLNSGGPTAQRTAYLVSAGRLQASQKKVSPNSNWTTLKPAGMASTLKSKARFSRWERRAVPDIPQFEHTSNSVHRLGAVIRADSLADEKQHTARRSSAQNGSLCAKNCIRPRPQAVGVPVLRSWETAVTSCAGAKGLVSMMLLGTPLDDQSSACCPLM
jgi:hypothetical protein